MRIAIFSDIHGNDVALSAMLAVLEHDAPDQIVCLGDVVVSGPQPQTALAHLRDLGCPVVMGNTDEWVLAPTPFTIRSQADQILYDVEQWGANQLNEDDKAFIHTFSPTITVDLGNGRSLLCFHGTPQSNRGLIRSTTPDDELTEKLADHEAVIFAGGHTHVPLLRRFRDSFVLNPGSVGLPLIVQPDGRWLNPAWAEYALITVENGRLDIALRHVSYHLDLLRAAVAHSAMPHKETYMQDWVNRP